MIRFHRWKIALAALTASLFAGLPLCGQDTPPPGVEVMARGPIHEAYAESMSGPAKEAVIVAKQPPADIEEMPPDQKPEGDNVEWMPGYWAFDEEKADFLWVSGFWRSPPPNRRWVPGTWKEAEGGWQWVGGFWGAAEQEEVTYLPPPPAPVEAGPSVAAPSNNHVWVPGSWVYREDHYAWRPGYYMLSQPNWIWVPAHYTWTPCGYVFVEGYWDHTLKDRGILFAPVTVDVALIRPGYVYTPTVIVHDECLYGALFVRPGCRCYYFGDYFEPAHRQAGYVAWNEVSVGYADPMFSYYRWEHRDDPQWTIDVQITFAGRYKGDIPRPAHTMVVNNNTTIINNNTTIINNNTTIVNNRIAAASGSMVMPLSQAASKGVKLQTITPEQRQAHYTAAKEVVHASQQRRETEKKILAQGPPPSKPTDKPRVAKLDLPKPNGAAAARTAAAAHPETHPAVTTAPHPAGTAAPHPAAVSPTPTPTVAHPTTPAPTHPATPTVAHPTTPAPAHPATPTVAHPTTPAPAHPATPTVAHPTTPAPTHPATPTVAHPTTPAPAHPATPTAAHPTPPAPGHPATPTAAHPTTPAPGHPATPTAAHPTTPAPAHPTTPTPGHPTTPAPTHPAPAPAHPTTPETTPTQPQPSGTQQQPHPMPPPAGQQ